MKIICRRVTKNEINVIAELRKERACKNAQPLITHTAHSLKQNMQL